MKTILLSVGILILLTLVWSCEGPEGPEGPAGQAGVNGTKGDPGLQGPQGPAGKTGNANVTAENFDVRPENWGSLVDTGDNIVGFYARLNASNVTTDIVNYGIVRVFMNLGTSSKDTIWYNLPYTFFYNTPTEDYFTIYNYTYRSYGVEISKYWSNGGANDLTAANDAPAERWFKVIAIAGTLAINYPELKWYNYSELKKAYPGIDKSFILK